MNSQILPETIYESRKLNFSYQRKGLTESVLKGVNLTIEKGAFKCLTGPSGSGKSTLLNLIGLIEAPQEGDLLFKGQSIQNLSEMERNRLRRFEIGYVFQDFQLIDVLSVEENIEFFLARQDLPPLLRQERIFDSLSLLGIEDHRKKRPHELSGGQKQRVAIARALAKHPSILIADEPTASLDKKTARELLDSLERIHEDRNLTIVMASHDPMVLEYDLDEIVLQDGQIIAQRKGPKHAV